MIQWLDVTGMENETVRLNQEHIVLMMPASPGARPKPIAHTQIMLANGVPLWAQDKLEDLLIRTSPIVAGGQRTQRPMLPGSWTEHPR